MSGIAQGISHAQHCVSGAAPARGSRGGPPARRWGTPGVRAPGRVAELAGRRSGQGGSDLVSLPAPRAPPGCSGCITTRRARPAVRRPPSCPRPRWSSPRVTARSSCRDCRRSWGWGPARCCHPTSCKPGAPRWPPRPSCWTPTCTSATPQPPTPPPRCPPALWVWGSRRRTVSWRTWRRASWARSC